MINFQKRLRENKKHKLLRMNYRDEFMIDLNKYINGEVDVFGFTDKHFTKDNECGLINMTPLMCEKRQILNNYCMKKNVKMAITLLDNIFDKNGCILRKLHNDTNKRCYGCNQTREICIYWWKWQCGVDLCKECKILYDTEYDIVNNVEDNEKTICNDCGREDKKYTVYNENSNGEKYCDECCYSMYEKAMIQMTE